MCQQCEVTLQHIESNFLQYHKELGLLTREIKKSLQTSIPTHIDEYSYGTDVSLIVSPQTLNVVLIEAVVIVLTSVGSITIGSRFIPLNAGTYNWIGLHWVVQPSDIRTVRQNAIGVLGFELMGHTLVDQGVY